LIAQDDPIYKIEWSKEKYYFGAGIGLLGADYYLLTKQNVITEAEVLKLDPLNLTSFERGAVYNNNQLSRDISDQFRNFCLLFPLVTIASEKGKSEFASISVMYLETLLINTAITSFSKVVVTRVRPFLYNENIPISEKLNKDANHSFFSGHVSTVSAMSFFTASVLSDLHPDSKYKWLWWTGAITLPGIAAFTRYDAGRHFITDVLMGYGVGALIGYYIPKLHKIQSDKIRLDVIPTQSSVSLSLKYTIS